MGITVGVANPGTISSVGVAKPGNITGVGNAAPGTISGVDVAHPGVLSNLRTPPVVDPNQGYLQDAQRQFANQQSQIQSLLASLRPAAPAKIDVAAINAQARKQAEESVNPLYTKRLNDMLSRLSVQRTRSQQDYEQGVQAIEQGLKQQQEANTLERGRTAEDVATNTGQINTAADQFQTQSGTAADEARLAEAAQLAQSGLTTSGVGQQQTQNAINQRNTNEAQQSQDFERQRTAQAVLKARTFEDLATSDLLSGQKAEQGKKSQKISLDRLIEDLGTQEQSQRFDIEQQRVADLASRTTDYSRLNFNNYLQGIRDPRVLSATAQAYGGLF